MSDLHKDIVYKKISDTMVFSAIQLLYLCERVSEQQQEGGQSVAQHPSHKELNIILGHLLTCGTSLWTCAGRTLRHQKRSMSCSQRPRAGNAVSLCNNPMGFLRPRCFPRPTCFLSLSLKTFPLSLLFNLFLPPFIHRGECAADSSVWAGLWPLELGRA